MKDTRELIEVATQVRRDIIRMVTNAASGHPGGSMSSADILTALYFNVMEHNPETWTREGKGKLKKFPENVEVIEIDGPMFFASSDKFSAIPIKEGVKVMILRMRNVPAMDSTATRTLFAVLHACEEQGITLLISHANAQPLAVMQKAGGKQCEAVNLFDIYRGPQVGEGKKSVSIRMTLRAEDRTLTVEDADKVTKKVLVLLERELGLTLRA
jgi:MFS superfamily sulfate permease-like transporter